MHTISKSVFVVALFMAITGGINAQGTGARLGGEIGGPSTATPGVGASDAGGQRSSTGGASPGTTAGGSAGKPKPSLSPFSRSDRSSMRSAPASGAMGHSQ
jgi:hypothetical protein